jgi:hypothetical protein
MPIQTAADSISNSQGSPFGFKNRIINGAMVIDQRSAGAAVTVTNNSNLFYIDRWRWGYGSSGTYTSQQVVDAPAGFYNSLKMTVTSTATVDPTNGWWLYQGIEGYNVADLGWGASGASTVTVSFWVKSSLTGTYAFNLENSGYNRHYTATYTINSANTWEYKTITVPGDTTGTWTKDNSAGIGFRFLLGAGSSLKTGTPNAWNAGDGSTGVVATGTVNWVTSASATWQVTGIQLEKGTQATAFDYRPFGIEYNLCARYFFSSYPYGSVAGANNDTASIYGIGVPNQFFGGMSFPTMMRTSPTVTGYHPNLGTAGQFGSYGDGTTGFTISGTRTSDKGFTNFLSSSSVTAGAGLRVNITASAEL